MTEQISKSIGGKQALKAAAILFALYEIAMLFKNTQGGVANGLLFFISGQMNGYLILSYALYFLLMYVAGRYAGYNILIKKSTYYSVALFNAFLSTALTLTFFESSMLLIFYNQPQVLEKHEIIETVLSTFITLLITLTVAWFWIAYNIKRSEGVTQ